ncbi:MAG TPA: ATP-binding protein, partial [Nitrososphaera sp.]|nr:ATP-binding protein [Nitrososphaera sp.]
EKLLPRLFEQFVTTKDHAHNMHGAGLGLNIAKSIVEAHGGTLVARNSETGTGAVFDLELPLLADDVNAKRQPLAS